MSVFCPLFSGSSGNCEYIGYNGQGILIDAGVSAKRLTAALESNSIDIKGILGIFVTHEHSDHISGLRVFASKYKIPVFCSEGTFNALSTDEKLISSVDIKTFASVLNFGGFSVERFATSHDCVGSSGYKVTCPDGKIASVCTDLGCITEDVKAALLGSNLVMLESNHDPSMLRNGPYPFSLKQRIASDCGHLSNSCCADFLPELIESGTTQIVLGHLSKENNRPSIALDCATSFLKLKDYLPDRDYYLHIAPESNGSILVI